MERIGIQQVQAGRVLLQAAKNAAGVLLCPAGTALTEALIHRLEAAGVEWVAVEGTGGEDRLRERLQELEQRFAGIEDSLLLGIKGMVVRHFQRQIARRD